MATYTDNYSLVKPGYGDQADIDVINRLMTDKVDALLFENRNISADGYDPARQEPYKVDELAIFENVLYKCIEPTSGIFDPSKWEMTNLATEIFTKGGADVTKTATGNPIEFNDGANAPLVKCVSEIQGSQDLHGYDKPWVGGAGKNKLPLVLADIKSENTSGSWSGDAYTISGVTFTILTDSNGNVTGVSANGTATENITFLLTDTNGSWMTDGTTYKINGSVGGSYNTWSIWVQGHGTHQSEMSLDGDGTFTYTAGGSTSARISVDSGVSLSNQMFKPMLRLSTESDSTFAPYSNICPITAYTEGEIYEVGKNRIKQIVQGYVNQSTKAIQIDNDSETVLFYAREGITYTLSSDATIDRKVIGYVGVDTLENGTPVSNITTIASYDTWTATWTGWTAWYIKSSASTVIEQTAQIEQGTTATTYEPYKGVTHTTTYTSAIYRGSEDVVNGEVTTEIEVKNISDFTWQYSPGVPTNRHYYISCPNDNILLSCYPLVNWSTFQNSDCCACYYGGYLRIKDTQYDDETTSTAISNFVTARGSEQIAYELATPTTSSVTPTNLPIKSLSGYNHIESSTGDMEVEYITGEYQPIIDLIESNKHVYSTAEQIVGTWVDGKTVYEKTVTGSFSNASTARTWHDILSTAEVSELAIDKFFISSGSYIIDPDGDIYTVPQTTGVSTGSAVGAIISGGKLQMVIEGMGSGTVEYALTIRYTKATTAQTRSLNLSKGEISEEKKKVDEEPIEEEKPVENDLDEWLEDSDEIEEEVDEGTDEDSDVKEEEENED